MRCPMCAEVELQPAFRDAVEVDVCPRCKGIWLDRGELEKILDRLDEDLERRAAPPSAPAAPLPPPPAAPPPPGWAGEGRGHHVPAGGGAPPRDDPYERDPRDRDPDGRDRDDRYERDRYERDRYQRDRYDDRYRGKGKRKKRKSFLGELLDELEIFD